MASGNGNGGGNGHGNGNGHAGGGGAGVTTAGNSAAFHHGHHRVERPWQRQRRWQRKRPRHTATGSSRVE
jgi:hypothetical protein